LGGAAHDVYMPQRNRIKTPWIKTDTHAARDPLVRAQRSVSVTP
jgi:hypothetical protein